MSRNTLARVIRLENAGASRGPRRLLVVTDQAEAGRLRAQHPDALIIVTGVPRGLRSDVR